MSVKDILVLIAYKVSQYDDNMCSSNELLFTITCTCVADTAHQFSETGHVLLSVDQQQIHIQKYQFVSSN